MWDCVRVAEAVGGDSEVALRLVCHHTTTRQAGRQLVEHLNVAWDPWPAWVGGAVVLTRAACQLLLLLSPSLPGYLPPRSLPPSPPPAGLVHQANVLTKVVNKINSDLGITQEINVKKVLAGADAENTRKFLHYLVIAAKAAGGGGGSPDATPKKKVRLRVYFCCGCCGGGEAVAVQLLLLDACARLKREGGEMVVVVVVVASPLGLAVPCLLRSLHVFESASLWRYVSHSQWL